MPVSDVQVFWTFFFSSPNAITRTFSRVQAAHCWLGECVSTGGHTAPLARGALLRHRSCRCRPPCGHRSSSSGSCRAPAGPLPPRPRWWWAARTVTATCLPTPLCVQKKLFFTDKEFNHLLATHNRKCGCVIIVELTWMAPSLHTLKKKNVCPESPPAGNHCYQTFVSVTVQRNNEEWAATANLGKGRNYSEWRRRIDKLSAMTFKSTGVFQEGHCSTVRLCSLC